MSFTKNTIEDEFTSKTRNAGGATPVLIEGKNGKLRQIDSIDVRDGVIVATVGKLVAE